MSDKKGDGLWCSCGAYAESECACGADWTPSRVYELEARLAQVTSHRDRLVAALEEIADSHDAPQNDQTAREALAAVKGGEDAS